VKQKSLVGAIIHIVDEDAAVRTNLARLLRHAGLFPQLHESLECFLADAHPALRACILLDITRPEVADCQLQDRLEQRSLVLPVIAVSTSDSAAAARRLGACLFLRKPVEEQALLDAIHWVIAGNKTS
jgi:FixJ family two-component response regulator